MLIYAVALITPWLLGSSLLAGYQPDRRPGHWQIIVGCGFFLGFALISLFLRIANFLAIEFKHTLWPIMALALTISLIHRASILAYFKSPAEKTQTCKNAKLPFATNRWLFPLCLTLITIKAFMVLQIYSNMPLYGWDAVKHWINRSALWSDYGQIVDWNWDNISLQWSIVRPAESFLSWQHPYTVSLIAVWTDTFNTTEKIQNVLAPWLLAPFALGLTIYGYVRNLGGCNTAAAVATYLFLSLPILNIHAMVGGYADIWMAGFIASILVLILTRPKDYNFVFLVSIAVFVFAIFTTKKTGLIFIFLIFTSFIAVKIRPSRTTIIASASFTALFAVAYYLGWLDFHVPVLGRILITPTWVHIFHYPAFQLGQFEVGYDFFSIYFLQGSWHNLFFIYLATLLARIIFHLKRSSFSLDFTAAYFIDLFVFFVIGFFVLTTSKINYYHALLQDGTTYTRVSLLLVIPVIISITNSLFFVYSEIKEREIGMT